jgi:hypothetical protein
MCDDGLVTDSAAVGNAMGKNDECELRDKRRMKIKEQVDNVNK